MNARSSAGRIVRALSLAFALCSCASAQSLGEIYDRVSPAVGIITVVERMPSPFQPTELTQHASLGSGVLISGDGKMVTAAHVVQAADNVFVQFAGSDKVVAHVQASDPAADIALLQLETVPDSAKAVPLGDSDLARVGDQIFIVGAPYGISRVLSVGYISARHRPGKVVKDFELGEFFQTDAAINTGNSGGPMFNMQGEVVGIVSSLLSRSGGFEGIGFVVTSNTARRLLIEDPSFWSGFEGFFLSGDLARALNLPQPEGVLVERVAASSPASRAGLRGGTIQAMLGDEALILGGDVLLGVQGIQVCCDSRAAIKAALRQVGEGGTVTLAVLRGGERIELVFKAGSER